MVSAAISMKNMILKIRSKTNIAVNNISITEEITIPSETLANMMENLNSMAGYLKI